MLFTDVYVVPVYQGCTYFSYCQAEMYFAPQFTVTSLFLTKFVVLLLNYLLSNLSLFCIETSCTFTCSCERKNIFVNSFFSMQTYHFSSFLFPYSGINVTSAYDLHAVHLRTLQVLNSSVRCSNINLNVQFNPRMFSLGYSIYC